MRSSSSTSTAALALISAAAVASSCDSHFVSAFVPQQQQQNSASSPSQKVGFFSRHPSANAAQDTKLYYTFGVEDDGTTSTTNKNRGEINPKNIQQYITEPPQSRTRSDLGSSVLVSGFVDPTSRTLGRDSDQAIFDLLNARATEDDFGFDFTDIVAFVPDAAFAKKRLVSRSARYSGLLNKLSFAQPAETDTLPTPDQLEGVTTWVARVESSTANDNNLEQIQQIVALAKSSSVQNVAFLLCDASTLDMQAALDVIKSLESEGGKSFTVVTVGLTDGDVPEATLPYSVADLFSSTEAAMTTTTDPATPYDTAPHYTTTIPTKTPVAATTTTSTVTNAIPADATYSREESFRLLATCLGLECGRNRALAFTTVDNVNATSYKLVKGLREAGYGWDQELEFMIEDGVENYDKAVEAYLTKHPSEAQLMTADEKLQDAIEQAMAQQEQDKEEALRRMEAKAALNSEFILEMSEDSITAPDWA